VLCTALVAGGDFERFGDLVFQGHDTAGGVTAVPWLAISRIRRPAGAGSDCRGGVHPQTGTARAALRVLWKVAMRR
jgi:hypothetical protein